MASPGTPTEHTLPWSTLRGILDRAGELLASSASEDGPTIGGLRLDDRTLSDRTLSERHGDRGTAGDLFVAIRGTRYDSHRSLDRLPGSSVAAALVDRPLDPAFPVPWLAVRDTRRALGLIEHARRGDPARSIPVHAITGTNGKSSTVRILVAILEASGARTGWWTTVDRSLAGPPEPTTMTTPGAGELAAAIETGRARGAAAMVVEVSSHALDQERVAGIPFAGAALTQLSRDHLDYHGDLRSYRDAKLRLAAARAEGAPLVLPASPLFREDLPPIDAPLFRHALDPGALAGEPGGTVLSSTLAPDGIRAELELLGEKVSIETALRGVHNLENILTAATLARGVGIPLDAIAHGVAAAVPVAGRLEEVPSPRGKILVDYAHTPAALDAVLASVREWCPGRLVAVFGCGGDRDRGKRPEMGAAAARHAHHLVVTSDNPRSEDPVTIIDDVIEGLPAAGTAGAPAVTIEPDRRRAIERAIDGLGPDDVLVIAGKGHEAEQIVGDRRIPFDDRVVVREILAEREGTP